MNRDIIDLGAAGGGWEEGLLRTRIPHGTCTGYDISLPAIATARAAGHLRVNGSFADVQPQYLTTPWGLIASPPCGGFSTAGLGNGRRDLEMILKVIKHTLWWGRHALQYGLRELREKQTDERSALVLEPLRWALAMQPEWMAWEQVPGVLPVWQACAQVLEVWGYSVDVGILSAEQYGVPQSRKRAVLVARRHDVEESQCLEPVMLPAPLYAPFDPARPDRRRMHKTLPPPMAISTALWRAGLPVPDENWVFTGAGVTSQKSAGTKARTLDYPAPTVTGKGTAYWVKHNGEPGQVIRRATVQELAVLQSFRADYPWQGLTHQQYQQVGDAIPPVLAEHIIRAATRGLPSV